LIEEGDQVKFVLLFLSLGVIVLKLLSIKGLLAKPLYLRKMEYQENMEKSIKKNGLETAKTIMGCAFTIVTFLYVMFYIIAAVYVGEIVFAMVSFGLVLLGFRSLSQGFKIINDSNLYNTTIDDWICIITDLAYCGYLLTILVSRW
jgi:hypothetical protein